MSGIYIKGMEMPDKCGHCRFASAFDCGVTGNFISTHSIRQTDCPLVPVPKHGRLIDADALMEKFLETYTEYERKKLLVFYAAEVKQEVADMITDAPTIIEAERGEE